MNRKRLSKEDLAPTLPERVRDILDIDTRLKVVEKIVYEREKDSKKTVFMIFSLAILVAIVLWAVS